MSGDEREWIARLFRIHATEIKRYLLRFVRDTSTAEDLLQETFLQLQRRGLSQVRSPRAFLYRIAGNLALLHLRASRNSKVIGFELPADVPDDKESPFDIVCAATALEDLMHELDRLSVRLRRVWVMRYVEGLSRDEIAAELDIKLSAVDQRLTRATSQLRNRLIAHDDK